jgi:3-oxoacyl-[acyl-carrier-protein] synthase II
MDRRQVQRTDRYAQAGVAAAALCHEDAGSPDIDPERTSVVLGTGNGGTITIIEEALRFSKEGRSGVSLLAGVKMMSNASAANVAYLLGVKGEVVGVAGGCASGTHSIMEAARLVQLGISDVVYTGAAEAALMADDPLEDPIPAGLIELRVHTDQAIARPFDRNRAGFVLSEGAAVLRLETLSAARARGARIYAEVLGGSNTADAFDLITPAPRGEGLQRAFRNALAQAGREPSEVKQVNVHGTATLSNDQAENDAITDVFGSPGPAVTSTKAVTGHPGAAAGSLEAVATILSIERKLIPPTQHLEELDPAITVDVVEGAPRPWEPGLAFSDSLGLGGQNGTVLLGPVEPA